ncbi:aldehyde dehydrogenase family protein [Nocardioides humi]|uniref:Aldehyde dehydrogenase family protein n=1 Tax=Nocardioides humi TaxID=449461 RepID=A0ABN2BQL1_9ACTN|nr:aldehyde dehydrogenase family protein [Nocardioides humi]
MTNTHEQQLERGTSVLEVPGHWIGGTVVAGPGDVRELLSPVDGRVVGRSPVGTPETVDRAVRAARAALPAWAATAPGARAEVLRRLADELTRRQEEIAWAITTEIGVPISFSRAAQATFPAIVTAATAGLVDEVEWEAERGNALVVREPVGVVGAITPWNFPLQQTVTKIVPALLAGNAVVLKPAETSPLTGPILAEAATAAGLPAGVLNIVYGDGPVVGEAIAAHPDVDMVSFTGSTAVGRHLAATAARTVKKVALELGGKTAAILLDDADLDRAIAETLQFAWSNAGQACGAWSRLLVPAARHDDVVRRLTAAAAAFAPGHPAEESTLVGPLASEAQWSRVNGYLETAVAEGAVVAYGGPGRIPGLEAGAFVRPTILTHVDPSSTIAQEEVFGPVLSVLTYEDEADALRIANGTAYGLTAAVYGDPARALSFARGLVAGQVYVNGAAFNPLAPFGGFRQSGVGREMGKEGVEEFTELKAILR